MKLVIFDCDGTLVDSQNIITNAMACTFSSLNMSPPDRAMIMSIIGLSLAEALAVLVPDGDEKTHHALAEGYKAAFFDLRQDPANHEMFYEGAEDALAWLIKRDDILLGIATGKTQRGMRNLLKRTGLNDKFVTVQTADVAASKPHPQMLHQAMAEAGVEEPENCLMVGDTTYDMTMAGAAGVHMLGVSWGYHDVVNLQASGAKTIIDDYAELVPHIVNLWGLEK